MFTVQRDNWESTGGEIPFNVVGIAARATYGYDNRYLAEVNIGYNGSEQFAPSNRFGFFPAFSAGWVISNEEFMDHNHVVTFFKLVAYYGKVGNAKLRSNERFFYINYFHLGRG